MILEKLHQNNMKLKNIKQVEKILPTDEAFSNWQANLFITCGIQFTLDVVIASYFMDIGYRFGMNVFSQFSFSEAKEDPINTAVSSYLDGDNMWMKELDTDTLDSLMSNCCLIQFGMKHPTYGDEIEYKKKFNLLLDEYNKIIS